jgi:hypothetical protein
MKFGRMRGKVGEGFILEVKVLGKLRIANDAISRQIANTTAIDTRKNQNGIFISLMLAERRQDSVCGVENLKRVETVGE